MKNDILASLARLTDDELAAQVKTLAAGVKLLAPHLTPENHRSVLESARWKSKLAIGEIVARLRPLPDVPTSVVPIPEFAIVPGHQPAPPAAPAPPELHAPATAPAQLQANPPAPPSRPAALTALSPQRYRLQVTISNDTLEKLRRAKDMLGHSVPAGDDDAVLNRALTVLLDQLAREKFAQTDKPRPGRPRKPRARRPSDGSSGSGMVGVADTLRRTATAARRPVASKPITSTRGCLQVMRRAQTRTSCVASATTTMRGGSTSASGDAASTPVTPARSRRRTVRDRSAMN